MNNALADLERAVLERLLEGKHPVLEALRLQLGACKVKSREFTGYGFFTELEVDPSVAAAPTPLERLRFGDVEAQISELEHGAGFVLFVDRGYLTMLEGYSYDEPWPKDVSDFALKFTGGSRDLAALRLDVSSAE